MMTIQEIGMMLDILEANYGQKFYDGVSKENVIKLWNVCFRDDDPRLVMQGVQNCVNTMSYKPTIADIRKRMAQAKIGGQMTPTEAFQEIAKAVDKVFDRESATKEFNSLSPIVRKVVGFPSQLTSWSRVSEEAFQTVIMSAIRESYKELAQREFDYHALPKKLQEVEKWRISAPEQEALPEPKQDKSIADIMREANEQAAMHGMQMTQELLEKHARRVNDFQKPMTDDEKKKITDR